MPSIDLLRLAARPPRRRGAWRALALGAALVSILVATGAWLIQRENALAIVETSAVEPARPSTLDHEASMVSTDASQTEESPNAHANEISDTLSIEDLFEGSHLLSDQLKRLAIEAGLGLVVAPALDREVLAGFPVDADWQAKLSSLSRAAGFSYAISDGILEISKAAHANKAGPGSAAESSGTPAKNSTARFADRRPASYSSVRNPHVPVSFAGSRVLGDSAPSLSPSSLTPKTTISRIELQHARSDEIVSAISPTARVLDVTVSADPGSNVVLLAGRSDRLGQVRETVLSLDVPVDRFLLEAEIVELSNSARNELGVEWRLEDRVSAEAVFPLNDPVGERGAVEVTTTGSPSVTARVAALEARGKARIVSRPRVFVSEGKVARIESVRVLRIRLPDRAPLAQEGGGAAAGDGRAVEAIPVGVSLNVVPSLAASGRIRLEVSAKSSTLGPPQPPDDIPEEFSRIVQADIVVDEGETAVLGGLFRQGNTRNATGIPLLRSVPIVGALFGKKAKSADDEELLVLITPKLMRPATPPNQASLEHSVPIEPGPGTTPMAKLP